MILDPPDADARGLTRFLTDSVGGTVDVWKARGEFATFSHGDRRVVFVAGPAHTRVVFARTDALYPSTGLPGPRNSAQRAFARGVFGISGEHHLFVRRLLLPHFRKQTVDASRERLAGYVREATAGWRAGQTLDLYREMKALSLLMTNRLLFGLDDPDLASRVDEAFDEWLDVNHHVSFAALTPAGVPDGGYERLLAAAERLGELLRRLIATARPDADGGNVLGSLVAARAAGELTEQDLVGLVHSLFNASHHTSTAALNWLLFLVSQHPEVNAAVLDELTRPVRLVAPDRPGLIDRVIRESLRVLPPVVYMCRYAAQTVPFGEGEVPAGAGLVVGLYVTQHMPGYFARPERFDPDRWLNLGPCPHANVPFGGGARMCLGAGLATELLEVALGVIVPRFRLTVTPGARIDRRASLTLRPAAGLPVLVADQDRRFTASPVAGEINEMVELPVAAERVAA